MAELTLAAARTLLDAAFAEAARRKLKPLAIVVLDARGALLAAMSQDGTPLMRWRIAMGKAQASLGMGRGSRGLGAMAVERPHFIGAVAALAADGFVPVGGGVLIRGADGRILGAVGVSGDTSEQDEAAAAAGVAAAGFVADGE